MTNQEIKIGDTVKILFTKKKEVDPPLAYNERMWVLVTKKIDNNYLEGHLNSDPMSLLSVKADDKIRFHINEIIEVWDETKRPIQNHSVAYEEQKYPDEITIFQHKNHPSYDILDKIHVIVDTKWDKIFLKEELLVEKIGIRKYKIMCIPMCVDHLCFDDEIIFDKPNHLEYTIHPSKEYTSIFIVLEEKSDNFFESINNRIVVEHYYGNYIGIAYHTSNQKVEELLYNELSKENNDKYSFLVKGIPE